VRTRARGGAGVTLLCVSAGMLGRLAGDMQRCAAEQDAEEGSADLHARPRAAGAAGPSDDATQCAASEAHAGGRLWRSQLERGA